MSRSDSPGPHDFMQPVEWGKVTSETKCVVIFLHGRGASPDDDLAVFEPTFSSVEGVAAIGLRAQDETWFPAHWNAPIAAQEPYLSSALNKLHSTITSLPVPPSRVVLLGFSQGAALAMTYTLQHPIVHSVLALSGSIVGAPGDWKAQEPGTGNPKPSIFLAWGDKDRHYNVARGDQDVKELKDAGFNVEFTCYPGMGHWVTQAELTKLEEVLKEVASLR